MGPGNHLGLADGKFARANGFEGLGRVKCIVLDKISPKRVKESQSPALSSQPYKHGAKHPPLLWQVKCIVLDSVYCTIGGVVREMADKYVGKVPILPFKTMIEPAVEVGLDPKP
jgi:hypothetical protein